MPIGSRASGERRICQATVAVAARRPALQDAEALPGESDKDRGGAEAAKT